MDKEDIKRKKNITLMIVPHDGQKIKSLEMSTIAFRAFVAIFAAAALIAALFSYKYFVLIAKTSQDELYLSEQQKQYGVLSKDLQEASDANTVFSAELRKTSSILNISRNQKVTRTLEGDFSQALYVNTQQYADLEKSKPFLAISEQLNNNIPILKDINASLEKQIVLMQQLPVFWPVPGFAVSIKWGPNVHPIYGYWYIHKGIDIAAPAGTPVYAVAEGFVKAVDFDSNNGLNVLLIHKYGFKTRYSHMGAVSISKGQMIKQGERLGSVGFTGMALEPHLDLQLYLGEDSIDPEIYLRLLNSEQYVSAANEQ